MGPLAIVGLGLIGTSIALAVRRAAPGTTIIGLDRGDSLDAAAAAEIIVLATPVDVTLDLLATETSRLRRALVLDTGSTKRAIVAAARAHHLHNFVGGHPMAGGTTPGPSDARADLFDGRPWFLIPAGAEPAALQRAHTFVEQLGAQPVVMSDDGTGHDRVMAAVSHLPQVVASSLMRVVGDTVGDDGLRIAGAGLKDTTRLARSSPAIWESVLATNAAELEPLLMRLAADLRFVAEHLDDPAAIQQLFNSARAYRDRLD